MIKMREIRERIREAVSHLYGLDDQLAELAERLKLPPDAEQMRIPGGMGVEENQSVRAAQKRRLQNRSRLGGAVREGTPVKLTLLDQTAVGIQV